MDPAGYSIRWVVSTHVGGLCQLQQCDVPPEHYQDHVAYCTLTRTKQQPLSTNSLAVVMQHFLSIGGCLLYAAFLG
jgi:hypothetical protein